MLKSIVFTYLLFHCIFFTYSLKSFKTSSVSKYTKYYAKYDDNSYDVVVIGAGIGGLCAGAILSSVYKQKVAIFESHYLPGGCAHSFDIKSKKSLSLNQNTNPVYRFDAGPTIILGCSEKPYNPLQQVLNFIGASSEIDWIKWKEWGMVTEDGKWLFELGPNKFENNVLKRFGGKNSIQEFTNLREACLPLTIAAGDIPSKALRGDKFKIIPLLPYLSSIQKVIPYADILDGSFKGFMDKYVTDNWLKSWLNALAFSLSGLPADKTGAAAMAYTLIDLHKEKASLDYPRGGMGKISDVLVDVLTKTGSKIYLSETVKSIAIDNKPKAIGVYLSNNTFIEAKKAVICNSDIWSLSNLISPHVNKLNQKQLEFFLINSTKKLYTDSFMHLHIGLESTGLDLSKMNAHYTVMSKGLYKNDPCSDRNMIAVSNPSVIDNSLVDQPNRLVIHAYSAGNEKYKDWEKFKNLRSSNEYKLKKQYDSLFLYDAISKSLDIPIDEIKERSEVSMIGTPLTHERYLRRFKGTYGVSWGEMLEGPITPLDGLYLAGDSIFPGIGVPAVALSGAIAANTVMPTVRHLWELIKSRN